MRSKKGMSPLIATVLLIAFAVALGAMIMNWSTDVQEPTAPEKGTTGDACAGVQIALTEVFGKQIFCYQEDSIKFNLVNTGTKEISGIQLLTFDADLKEFKQDIPSSRMVVGATFEHTFPFDKSGKVHVKLIPFVFSNNEQQYCHNQQIVQDVLPECSE